ncbi:MAG: PRC-barrel domain-containing protein [Deltaproteobacteria bacterium]|nr:PRC-barrel domain-containing protein [Deltaproteobacteria bacterium]
MRLRYTELKGMTVLADKEGKLLGSVRKLQVDSKRKMTVGLVFKSKSLSGERWAKVSKIQRVGEDVVFLADEKAVREDAPNGRDVRDLLGLPVTSLDGKRLGALDDLIFETDNWSIAALALDSGGEVDLSKDAVFGEDTILLQKGAFDLIRQSSSSGSGFLARVFAGDEEETPKKPRRKTRAKIKPKKKATKGKSRR